MPKNLFQTTLYRFLFLFVRVKREVLENGREPTKKRDHSGFVRVSL